MDAYKYEKIRNVAVLGHGGCGKSTLVEACAYTTGIIKRQGSISEGNTISDYTWKNRNANFQYPPLWYLLFGRILRLIFLDAPILF